MDFLSPNCAFLDQSTDDLSQIFNLAELQQLEDDPLLGNTWTVLREDAGNSTTKKRSRCDGKGDGSPNVNVDMSQRKKIVHRDVERQRRQEMSNLYASLRTMLPLQCLKGRKSMSDHMHGAVNYIKHLQSRIEELKKKRGELQNWCNGSDEITNSNSKRCSSKEYYAQVEEAIVRPCLVGAEVVISTRPLKQRPLPLSCLLEVVAGAGLTVVRCNSTQVNGRFVHTILSEVSCLRSIDLFKLQEKLKKLRVP